MPTNDAGNSKKKSAKGAARTTRGTDLEAAAPEREAPTKRGAGFAWLLTPHPGKLRHSAVGRGGTLGKSADATIVVDGPGVAPIHAQVDLLARPGVTDPVTRDGDGLEIFVTDASTPAGTYVGGMRTQRTVLHEGDILRLGSTLAIVVERDIESYEGNVLDEGELVRGPRSRKGWFAIVERACADQRKEGRVVLVSGAVGTGRRTVAARIANAWSGVAPVIEIDLGVERGEGSAAAIKKLVGKAHDKVIRVHAIERATPAEMDALSSRPASASLVATSDVNVPLQPHVASQFEGSTFHRVDIPSIEDRREEIPTMIRARFAKSGVSGHRLSVELYEALTRAAWPGEIAELCAAVDAIAAAHTEEPRLGPEHLVRPLARRGGRMLVVAVANTSANDGERIRAALAAANGSVAAAARSLQLSRQALYREAARLGIDIRRAREPGEGPTSER
ncbi:MAG: FHA domain-containing protein [Polyangiales bacterium]